MDLNQIAVFVRIVESGSLSKAAQALKQPKSRVSRRLAALERELGVALIFRNTRQFSPTEAGLNLYRQCRQQVYDLEAAARSLQDDAHEVSGLLKITTTEDMGTTLLAPLLAELTSLYPRLRIDLDVSPGVVDLVKEGIDVAIRFGNLKDTTLKARSLGQTKFILVASPAYLSRSPAVEKLSDLAAHACLVFRDVTMNNQWHLKAGQRREETVAIHPHITANSPRVLLDLAQNGKGIALIPEFLGANALKDGRLERLLAPYATAGLPVHLVWPAKRALSPKLRTFIDLSVKRFSPYFT